MSKVPDGGARADLERWINGVWYGGHSGGTALRPLSVVFGAGAAIRRWAYRRGMRRSKRVGAHTVVIGNVTVGGTGKTPLTIWLARSLLERHRKVAVICRGYGGDLAGVEIVPPGSAPSFAGDEAALIADELAANRQASLGAGAEVIAGRDRVAAAELAVQRGAQIVICDDGLQHYRLARDLEIGVVDGVRGLGNGRLLPAGPLREPAKRLSAVDFVVINGAPSERTSTLSGRRGALQFELVPQPLRPIGRHPIDFDPAPPAGARVHAVAGIGHPQRFFETVRGLGYEAVTHAFPDHHGYAATDLAFGDDAPILMTSKDAIKCRAFAHARMWELPVDLRMTDAAAAQRLLAAADIGR